MKELSRLSKYIFFIAGIKLDGSGLVVWTKGVELNFDELGEVQHELAIEFAKNTEGINKSQITVSSVPMVPTVDIFNVSLN